MPSFRLWLDDHELLHLWTGSVQLPAVMVQVMWPVVSPPITAFPAARWPSATRAGWRPSCRTRSARETSSLARGARKIITVAGTGVWMYVCVNTFLRAFTLHSMFRDFHFPLPSGLVVPQNTERTNKESIRVSLKTPWRFSIGIKCYADNSLTKSCWFFVTSC